VKKQWILNAVTQDFYKNQPRLVFVDTKIWLGYYNNKKFDYIGFFSQEPEFAKLFRCYAYLTEENGFKIYQKKAC